MSTTKNTVLVRYLGNADGSATGALSFDDDRPNISLGGVGYVTSDEIARLSTLGVVLDTSFTTDEADELGIPVPGEPTDTADLDSIDQLDVLKQIAADEGVETAGLRSKEAVRTAIVEHRTAQAIQPPATAPPSPVESVGSGDTGAAS